MTIDQKIHFLGTDKFVKFPNIDSLEGLTSQTSRFLSQYGVYSNKKGYPYVTITHPEKISTDYIKLGETHTKSSLCIDIGNNDRIILLDDDGATLVNSNVKTYIECLYALYYFSKEIEWKNTLGEYSLHRKKYAQSLLEMFNEIEGNIENFPIWHVQVYERELGSL
jgi:hypothetical protein